MVNNITIIQMGSKVKFNYVIRLKYAWTDIWADIWIDIFQQTDALSYFRALLSTCMH